MPNLYHDYYDLEPREISSTYEGRHVTLPAELLNSPAGGGVIVAKDPVTFGNVADGYGVGVAFNSGSGTDQIAIDTEGIWVLDVVATDDEGASAVRIGDIIFINRTTCVLSKISSDTTNIVFGYALDTIASGTHGIAVKVHWDPWYDIYRDYLAGGAAEDALLIDVDDARIAAAGYGQGLQVTYRQTGAKTVAAEVHPIAADLFLSGAVPYAYCYTAYIETTGNPAVGQQAGLSIYLADPGANLTHLTAIDIGLDGGTNSPAERHAFMRMRNHAAGAVPDCHFLVEGSPSADHFVRFTTANTLPIVGAAVGGTQLRKIAIDIDGVVGYIPVHSA
jgi:hypothetical protein